MLLYSIYTASHKTAYRSTSRPNCLGCNRTSRLRTSQAVITRLPTAVLCLLSELAFPFLATAQEMGILVRMRRRAVILHPVLGDHQPLHICIYLVPAPSTLFAWSFSLAARHYLLQVCLGLESDQTLDWIERLWSWGV